MDSGPTVAQLIIALSHPDLSETQISQLPGFGGDAAMASRISLGAHDWHQTGRSALLPAECVAHLTGGDRRKYVCARCDTPF
jgi:hypothetical protein